MQTKPYLTLDDLKKIAAGAEAEAKANNWAVVIAIVDDGGHLLWLQRLDGAAPASSHIAPAKAKTAALGRRETKIYEDMINNGRFSFLCAPELDGLLHRVGNDSPEIGPKLRTYEQWIDELLLAAQNHYSEVHLYVFSDHGMANCDEHLDLKARIEALQIDAHLE